MPAWVCWFDQRTIGTDVLRCVIHHLCLLPFSVNEYWALTSSLRCSCHNTINWKKGRKIWRKWSWFDMNKAYKHVTTQVVSSITYFPAHWHISAFRLSPTLIKYSIWQTARTTSSEQEAQMRPARVRAFHNPCISVWPTCLRVSPTA